MAGLCSRAPPEEIDRAVAALLALAFDLAGMCQASRARILRSSGAPISLETALNEAYVKLREFANNHDLTLRRREFIAALGAAVWRANLLSESKVESA